MNHNFSILRILVASGEGNLLAQNAVPRLKNLNAPRWMILGVLASGPVIIEQEPSFGFTPGWFGNVAELSDCNCEVPDEAQGEC